MSESHHAGAHPNTPFLRWLIGLAGGLAVLHLALVLLWGRGQVLLVLPAYAVVMDSVTAVAALAVAVLAFGRYWVSREPTPFWGGVAFAAFALFALFDSLTAPGVLPGGRSILGHLPGTSSWFWHLMFSALGLFLVGEILLPWPRRGARGERWWWRLVLAGALGGAGLSALLIAAERSLPLLIVNGAWTPLNQAWTAAILGVFAVGTVLSARRYRHTGSVPCACLTACQLLLTFAMVTDLTGTRLYDVWWYWRRLLFVGAFSVMLFGMLLEYVQLYWRERGRTGELTALQCVSDALRHAVELAPVAEVIVDESMRVLPVDAAAVWLADPPRRELTLLTSRGHSAAFVQANRRLSFDAPDLAALVARTERPQGLDAADPRAGEGPEAAALCRDGLHAALAVPLCTGDQLVGVVGYATRPPRRVSAAHRAFITAAAGLFAGEIANARLYEQLRQALRLREAFMEAAAHELRSPVTVIQCGAELALKADACEEPARVALERILRAAKRIDRLVEDLFAVLRVRPGALALGRERLDLSALAESAVARTKPTTERHDFQLTMAGPLPVEADRALIGEVLHRLLENAMRSTPDGGVVRVEARRQDREAVVAVTDYGGAIPPERQPFAFEPFYEVMPGGSPGYTGLVSLGLYVSKQIIEGHGGRIWLASTPSSGTTFSFSLPLAPEAARGGFGGEQRATPDNRPPIKPPTAR